MSSSSRRGSIFGSVVVLGSLFASAPALADESAAPAPVPAPPGVVDGEAAAPAPTAPAAPAADAPAVEPEESLSAPAPRLAPARVPSVPAEAAPPAEPAKIEPMKLQFVPGPTKDATSERPKKGGENGVLGPVRIGPMVGAGVPGFMTVGANARIAKLVGLGVNYGYSPELTVSSVSVSVWNAEGYARLYPFKSAFFIGAGVGQQKLSGRMSQDGGTGAGSVTTTYVAPTLGFMWTWDFGLALGFDVGVQLPVSNTRQFDATYAGVAVPASELKDLDDTLKKIGTTPIPVLNALRVGFLF